MILDVLRERWANERWDRQLRISAGTVQAQPAAQVVRGDGAHYALPELGMREQPRRETTCGGEEGARCFVETGVRDGAAVAADRPRGILLAALLPTM